MSSYRGKKVYITGGSSGIGKATAIELARRGASVMISARGEERMARALEEIQSAARDSDQQIGAIALDVSDQQAVEVAATRVIDDLGGLDILINNAGVSVVGRLEDMGPDDFRRVMDTNYFGSVWTTLAFRDHFQQQRRGVIAGVSSLLGVIGCFGYTAYAASKFALTGFYDCLRQDLLKYGIQVSVVFPADTDTPQFHQENRTKPEETKMVSATTNVAMPAEIAGALLDGIAAGKYQIIPGLANRFVISTHGKAPWLVRWFIDRDLRKVWRSSGLPGNAARA